MTDPQFFRPGYYSFLISCLYVFTFLPSCGPEKHSCRDQVIFLMENVSSSTLDSLMGFSAIARGIDDSDKPFVTRIEYTNYSRTSFSIPSFQKRRFESDGSKSYDYQRDSLLDYTELAKLIGLDTIDARSSVIRYSTYVKDFFHRYEIRSMTSLLDLGDFITFELGGNCIINYKPKDGEIRGNMNLRNAFTNSLSLGNGWYIFTEPKTADFIKQME